MILAKIRVSGVRATPVDVREIPKGIIGGQVLFEYTDPMWDDYTKTVVFEGAVTKDVIDAGELVTIPKEVVAQAWPNLRVGVYGTNGPIPGLPTLYANLGRVLPAADPSEDESTDPALPVWAQLEGRIEKLEENGTGGGFTDEVKNALMAAVDHIGVWTDENGQAYVDALRTALFGTTEGGGGSDGGEGEEGGDDEGGEVTPVTYTIIRTLIGCSSDNSSGTVTEGATHTETLTAVEGYTLDGATVSVTMGGADISSAYVGGVLTIASVTGNIVITATAVEKAVEEPVVLSGYQLEAKPGQANGENWGYTGWSGNFATAIKVNAQYYKKLLKPGTYYMRSLQTSAYITESAYGIYTTNNADFMTSPTTATALAYEKMTKEFTHNGESGYVCIDADGGATVVDTLNAPTHSGVGGYVYLYKYVIPDGSYGIITSSAGVNANYLDGYETIFTSDPSENITVTDIEEAEVFV